MPRLIDANEALRMMRNSKADNPCTDTIRNGVWNIAHDCAISCVDACPTVDAVEVVHGKWEKAEYSGFLRCDQCKDVYINEEWLEDGKWNYCPNCGADMR